VNQDNNIRFTNLMTALFAFLQSREVKLIAITVVIGDAWPDEEVAHAPRLLELQDRTDVKVYAGAEYSLVRTQRMLPRPCARATR
jgi:inosine-uridine nucleoside N-ribohydrolase